MFPFGIIACTFFTTTFLEIAVYVARFVGPLCAIYMGYTMPSNPGQNLHLVSSQKHAVASSSHLANSSSQLVVLSSYLVESSSHLVVLSILLTSPLLVYSSVILQLVVSPFNSSCRTSTRRSLYPYILVSVSHIFVISL